MKTADKQFYRSFFAVVVPIAIQNLINSAVGMADTLMPGLCQPDRYGLQLPGGANTLYLEYVLQRPGSRHHHAGGAILGAGRT